LRRILHDCNRFEDLLHAVTRTILVDQVFAHLQYHRDICGGKTLEGSCEDIKRLVRTALGVILVNIFIFYIL
jgi:hypothetical protein